jgi:hypothetical protein
MKQSLTRAALRRCSAVLICAVAAAASGCGGDGGGGDGSPETKSTNAGQESRPSKGNTPPSISASPASVAQVGQTYSLIPVVQDPDGDALAFAIENRPAWAQFSTVTGELTGTPTAAHAGTYENIRISVSDGTTTAALAPFSIVVKAPATDAASGTVLQWDLPTETTDGQPLGSLAGIRIHYGKSADTLVETIEIRNPGVSSYVVENLAPGTYYFAVRAFTATGEQSPLSNLIAKVIG